MVEALEQGGLVARVQVAQAGHVDRDDAYGARELGRAEQTVAPLQELAQVELEAAAHRADHARVELGVDEVLEVGQAVLRGHIEQARALSDSQSKSFVML